VAMSCAYAENTPAKKMHAIMNRFMLIIFGLNYYSGSKICHLGNKVQIPCQELEMIFFIYIKYIEFFIQ
jgi:hypothetical protein